MFKKTKKNKNVFKKYKKFKGKHVINQKVVSKKIN